MSIKMIFSGGGRRTLGAISKFGDRAAHEIAAIFAQTDRLIASGPGTLEARRRRLAAAEAEVAAEVRSHGAGNVTHADRLRRLAAAEDEIGAEIMVRAAERTGNFDHDGGLARQLARGGTTINCTTARQPRRDDRFGHLAASRMNERGLFSK